MVLFVVTQAYFFLPFRQRNICGTNIALWADKADKADKADCIQMRTYGLYVQTLDKSFQCGGNSMKWSTMVNRIGSGAGAKQ